MAAALTNPARIPFDYGFFYHAMIGLLGREPDCRVQQGLDGFYDLVYKTKRIDEDEELERAAFQLRKWLDIFDITFSDSHCEYEKNEPHFGACLRVVIRHPVTPETKAEADALHCNLR